MEYAPSTGESDFAEVLAQSRSEEARLRTTAVGPHRDDLLLKVNGMLAAQFASEGQQRSLVLALKLALVLGLTVAPLWLADIAGLASMEETAAFSLRIDVLLITTVVVTVLVVGWRKLFKSG